jgi:hypothetical protein
MNLLWQVLQEYIASTNSLKEVNMHKHVTGFDTAHVCNVVTEHIRNQLGFQRRISVYVTYPDSCVKVVTPTNIAQCACRRTHCESAPTAAPTVKARLPPHPLATVKARLPPHPP